MYFSKLYSFFLMFLSEKGNDLKANSFSCTTTVVTFINFVDNIRLERLQYKDFKQRKGPKQSYFCTKRKKKKR